MIKGDAVAAARAQLPLECRSLEQRQQAGAQSLQAEGAGSGERRG